MDAAGSRWHGLVVRFPCGLLVLLLAAGCDDADPADGSGGGSAGATAGDDGGPASTGGESGDEAGTSNADDTGDGTSGSSGDGGDDDGATGDSTGEVACPEGADPSDYAEVEGCDAVLGEPLCSEGQAHVEIGTEIDWMSNPPNSGPHFPMWEPWGEHESTVERGYWVHNLEHGGVVLSYLCPEGCDAELEVLREVIEARPDSRILMTPDPDLPGPARFAAISWTWVHRFDDPTLDELLCFVDQHFNHAPEDVP